LSNIQADKWSFEGLKYSAFENAAGQNSGCTPYAALPRFKSKQKYVADHEANLKRCLRQMTAVYKHIFADAMKRMERVQKHLVTASSLSISGGAVAIGKNFSSSVHTDPDVGFTFEGSWNTGSKTAYNAFCFPLHKATVMLKKKDTLELFMFNSAVLHAAETVKRSKDSHSYLFSLYTSQVVAREFTKKRSNEDGQREPMAKKLKQAE